MSIKSEYETKYDIPIGIGLIISLIIGYSFIIDNEMNNQPIILGVIWTTFNLLITIILVRILGKKRIRS